MGYSVFWVGFGDGFLSTLDVVISGGYLVTLHESSLRYF